MSLYCTLLLKTGIIHHINANFSNKKIDQVKLSSRYDSKKAGSQESGS